MALKLHRAGETKDLQRGLNGRASKFKQLKQKDGWKLQVHWKMGSLVGQSRNRLILTRSAVPHLYLNLQKRVAITP